MGLLNNRFIDREISRTGNTCDIVERSLTYANDAYRTPTESKTTNSGIKAWVRILNEEDETVQEGEARSGDLVFWVSHNHIGKVRPSNNEVESNVVYEGETYRIYDVRNYQVADTSRIVEIRTRQV